MLCDCFGNMMKVEIIKFVKGRKVKTGKFRRICSRCSLNISETQYKKMEQSER